MVGATAAVTTLISKLDALQHERYKLSRRVRRDIAAIADELRSAHDVVAATTAAEAQRDLHKAPSSGASAGFSQFESTLAAVRSLIDMLEDLDPRSAAGYCSSKLREVCYVVEDIVDEFTAYVDQPPATRLRRVVGGGLYRSAMEWMAMALTRRTVAIESGQLKRQALKKREDLDRLMKDIRFVPSSVPVVEDRPPMHRCLPPPTPALDTPPTNFNVGDQRDRVAELLFLGEPSVPPLAAVTIVGPAGIGKTTLAGEVWRIARTFFDFCFWVSTSPNSSYKSIFIDILRQVEDPCRRGNEDRMSESDIKEKIKKSLQHKRYLVVLDNVSISTARSVINYALPRNSPGSRVIVTTTCDYLVEELVGCPFWNCHTYCMPLDSLVYGRDSARLLLHKRVFGSTGSCPPDLVDVADKILCKCSGMPLAITLVSGLLANKPFARTVWEDVYKFIAASTPDSEGGKRNLVLLCYHGLPNYLKTCLLYLNIFPVNHLINRDRVVRSWIAEGFVFEKHGRTLEEEGERYFSDLVQRGMIQSAGGCNGNPDAFMIHGFVLDLIKSKLVRDNFVTLLLDKGTTVVSKPTHKKVRRLSVTSEDHDIPKSMAISDIRALYVFTGFIPKLPFKKLVFLRVLDLEGCKDLKNHDIVEIAGLKHLRYLSIKDTPISELPDQIGQLQHLTTLDIRGTKVQAMPTSVVQLRNLTNLLCDKMRFQEWIGKMTSITCLSQFDIFQSEVRAVEELGSMSELRKLALWWFPDAESHNTGRYYELGVTFYRLKKLQSLYIDGADSSVDILDYLQYPLQHLQRIQLNRSCYLSRIPEWFSSLPRLAYVCTSVKEIKNEDFQLLSQLPSLRHLSLSSKVLPTEKLVIGSRGFPVLQKFQLNFSRADLTFEPHAMQKLKELLLSVHVLPEETYALSISIDQFLCLERIDIIISGDDTAASHLLEATNVAIRNAAEEHPNHPMVSVISSEKVGYAANRKKENEQE